MKKFIFLILLLVSQLAAKSQVVGAELTYKCLDTAGNYELTLVYYRDCNSTPACAASSCSSLGACGRIVDVFGGDPAYVNTKYQSISLAAVSVRDVIQHPQNGEKSICTNLGCVPPGKFSIGYERYEFKGIVNIGSSSSIPSACCNVRFVYSECCRNQNTQNYGGNGVNYYTDAIVNRCAATYPNCNSVVFTNEPYLTIASGTAFYYNNGAVDPDQDSLVYSFTPALTDYNTSVLYTNPYSYNVPMPYTAGSGGFPNGIAIDAISGDFYFKPNVSNYYGGLSIRVDQIRRINNVPVVVGVSRRDMSMNIIPGLTNNEPVIRTIPVGTPSTKAKTKWEVCAGTQLCFTVIAKDTDVSDTTFLTWNKSLEKYGATFLPTYTTKRDSAGPREDSYQFCWTPQDSVANKSNNQDFTFTITAEDNRASFNGNSTKQFNIHVFQRASVTIVKEQLDCNKIKISYVKNLVISPVQVFNSVQWKIAQQPGDNSFAQGSTVFNNVQTIPSLRFSKNGKYLVQLSIVMAGPNNSATTCSQVYFDTIEIKQALNIRVNDDTTICKTGYQFIAKLISTDTAINSIKWYSLPDTTNVLVTLSQFVTTPTKNASYLMIALDNETGCKYSDTLNIYVGAVRANFGINLAQQCFKGNSFVFSNQSYDTIGNALIAKWQFSNGDSSSATTSLTKVMANIGSYSVKLKAYSAFGCVDSITKSFDVFNSPTADFTVTNPSTQCLKGNSYSFSNQSSANGDGLIYAWTLGANGSSSLSTPPSQTYSTTGPQQIKLIVYTQSHACPDTLNKTITIIPSPTANFTINNANQCLNGNLFTMGNQSSISSGSLSQIWEYGDGNGTTFGSPSYVYQSVGSFQIKLKVTSNLGCADSMTSLVTVLPYENANLGIVDSALCLDRQFHFYTSTGLPANIVTNTWIFGDNNIQQDNSDDIFHKYTNPGSYWVSLVTETNQHCKDSTARIVVVNEMPIRPVITGDTLVYRHSIQPYSVIENTGSTYNWKITGDSLHSISSNNAVVYWGPNANGTLTVFETNLFGCNSDTVTIKVRIIPNVGILETANKNELIIYPQPANDKLYLSGKLDGLNSITLSNIEGKMLRRYSKEDIQQHELNINDIKSGVYFLYLSDGINQPFIKKVSIIK